MRRQENEGGYREGFSVERTEGLAEGQQKQLASIVQKKLQKGLSLMEIADFLEEDIEILRKVQKDLDTIQ